MKRISFLLIAVAFVGAAGCGDDNPTPQPSNLPVIFSMPLFTNQEVPPIQGAEATGSGTVTITFNLTKDAAGTITAATANFQCNLQGFPATTTITISHIHEGVAGAAPAGNIVVNTTLASGETPLTNGAGSFTKSNINVDAALATRIIANPAGFYFNVHSQANGPGVIRGQLVRIQ
jgi:CHRD domain